MCPKATAVAVAISLVTVTWHGPSRCMIRFCKESEALLYKCALAAAWVTPAATTTPAARQRGWVEFVIEIFFVEFVDR